MKLLLIFAAACTVAYGRLVPKFGSRIVGGVPADISQVPYQVSVRMYDQHMCGGSIINQYNILTAAHCVYGMDHSQYSVSVGNTYHNYGTKVKVSQILMNTGYSPDTMDYDMAILKLASPLQYSNTVQPIGLQPRGVQVRAGETCWVSGWGVLYEGSKDVPEELRMVDVQAIDNCNAYYPGRISTTMNCALTNNKDSCQGDSGGPLNYNGLLCGVVSWGVGCARPGNPGVYASVPDMHDWIMNNT